MNNLIADSLPPSGFVRDRRIYRNWCSVTVCPGCGLRAKYEDQHPVDPCRCCGERLTEKVGRWVKISRGWFRSSTGYWQLRDESLSNGDEKHG